MKRNAFAITFLFAAFLLTGTPVIVLSSCSNAEQPEPTPNPEPDPPAPSKDLLPSYALFKLGATLDMDLRGSLHLPYSGLSKGDKVTIISRLDGSSRDLPCTAATDTTGAFFSTPQKFIGGMFTVILTHDGSQTFLGETFVNVIDPTGVTPNPGMTTYGRVVDYEGKPVQDVVVSDGVIVTTTDAQGRYYMASVRKNGFVFISVPKNYRVAVNRSIPQFFKRLLKGYTEYEQHNFVLEPEDNTRHRVLILTDFHLANRTNDVSQFNNYFKPDLVKELHRAKTDGVKLYGITLGDLTWDEFWYDNSFMLEDYRDIMADLDIPIYNIPGNHDNDPYVSDDFKSEADFRRYIGPVYYSFNIGDIHYIQMDNTIFNNAGGSQGVIGNVQDYTSGYTSNQLKWLKADLEKVPTGTTVFFGTHIHYSNRERAQSDGTFAYTYNLPAQYRQELLEIFANYNVHIITGHTHVNYSNRFSEKLMEHNTASVTPTWWWTGYYTNGRSYICTDGSPSGYRVFDINSTNNVKWYYQAFARDAKYQFRAYDLNNCYISREVYCPKSNSPNVSDSFFSKYAGGYDVQRTDNKILVNVFDYDPSWKVQMFENGKSLTVKRVDAYDPLHVIHFNMNRMKSNSTAMTFPTVLTSHMFEATASNASSSVTISVTDSFGRVYTETMARPRRLYDMSNSSIY